MQNREVGLETNFKLISDINDWDLFYNVLWYQLLGWNVGPLESMTGFKYKTEYQSDPNV